MPPEDRRTIRADAPAEAEALKIRKLRVRVASGERAGTEASFSLPVVRLGSARDNDLVLPDGIVSRHHAELHLGEEGLVLEDLGSTNGSFVDGTKVLKAPVPAGARVSLGGVELELRDADEALVPQARERHRLGPLVGASPAMQELYGLLEAAAPTQVSVLIQGESGTGKELVAQTLHELSGRPGPLVIFDAASTDVELIRSELFGHEEGAFTGAKGARAGAFREADGGTLFLDEIGELPLDLQPRLLRVLESRQVQPLGSDKRHRVDVRVLAATHRDLPAMVAAGEFRADLFHRLAVVPVQVPPLRERAGDVPLLVEALRESLGLGLELSPAASKALAAHPWPGNVRELRNVLERSSVLVRGRAVTPEDLRLGATAPPGAGGEAEIPAGVTLKDLEKQAILETLERLGGNKTAAAKELGIGLSTLKDKLKKYQA